MIISNFAIEATVYDDYQEAKERYDAMNNENCLFSENHDTNRFTIVEVKIDGVLFAESIECEILVTIQKILEIAAEKLNEKA